MNHTNSKEVSDEPKSCKMCGISAKKSSLHKISSDSSNAKEIVLCQACIPVHFLSILSVRESEKIRADIGYETELQVSKKKEPRVRVLVYRKVSESENLRLEEHDLVNSVAEETGISPTTARRYLDKMCSSSGVLKRVYDGNDTYIEFNLKKADFQ